MKYTEVFNRQAVLKNIPLEMDGAKMRSELVAKVVLARVAYDKAVKVFEDDMQEVVKTLKPEGFDDRAQKMQKLADTDKKAEDHKAWEDGGKEGEEPGYPTEEELKEAEEARPGKEAYDKELGELNEKYAEARRQKLDEESKMAEKVLTEADLAGIVDVTGVTGTMKVNWGGREMDIDKEVFISMIAEMLV